MKTIISRKTLKEGVAGFSKVIAGKSTIPVLGCVRFDAGKDGIVAQSTNLDEVVEYRFDGAEVHGVGGCIIPLSTLKDLAKGTKSEQVEIEAEDPLNISVVNHVGGHAVRRAVPGMDLDEWPAMSTDIETKPGSGFLETYRRLIPFSSRDETRYILNGIYVEKGTGPTPISMVSTDGRRLACFNSMAFDGVSKSVIVPASSKFLNWKRLPSDVEIGVREDDGVTWLGVRSGAFTFAIKTIDGSYPNYRQVIPAETGDHVITFGDGDVELLKQVLPTFNPDDSGITIVGGDGKVTIYGSGADDKATSLKLESTTFAGERMFVGVDSSYLLDAMAAGFREFAVADELSPLVSRDGNGGLHVQMPLRGVQDPEDADETEQLDAATATIEEPGALQAKGGPAVEQVEPQAKVEPAAEPVVPAKKPTIRKETQVTKKTEQKTSDPSALDRVLTACDAARAKVKESGQALTELTTAIREAAREQKSQSKEVESARQALAKLQAISL